MLLMTESLQPQIRTRPYCISDLAYIGAQRRAQLLLQTKALPLRDLTPYAVRLLFYESIRL